MIKAVFSLYKVYMSQQYQIHTKARHLRYIFFVEEGYDSIKLLEIFQKNQSLWGGRLNPIIPINNNNISDSWKNIIKHHDPDYIFHTPNFTLDFVKKICIDLEFNPLEICDISDLSNRIYGVSSGQLFDTFKHFKRLIEVNDGWKSDSPLKEYFELNYMISASSFSDRPRDTKYELIRVNYTDYATINGLISKDNGTFFNKTLLASTNLDTIGIRDKDFTTKHFEIIIAKDYNSFDDLIYFWNRNLFIQNQTYISHIIVTNEQLKLLLQDSDWANILNQTYSEGSLIDIVSFSLSPEELAPIELNLKEISRYKRFRIIDSPSFPFEILDHQLLNWNNSERMNIQTINAPEHTVSTPLLSFGDSLNKSPAKWAVDIQIKTSNRTLKFPYTYDSQFTISRKSRVNRHREFSALIDGQMDDHSAVLNIRIPKFYDTASQLITSPRFINQKPKYLYSEIGYNDSSSKLKEFLKLFESFHSLQEFISDKFWMDFFYELSSNARTEGDCFTFSNLFVRCLHVLKDKKVLMKAFKMFDLPKLSKGQLFCNEIASLKPSFNWEISYRLNENNLRRGLIRTVQELVEYKVLLPGFTVKCEHCSSTVWYSINNISDRVVCRGCSNYNDFQAETPLSYKLNSLVKNNIAMRDENGKIVADGNMTVIRTLCYLSQEARQNFEYLPQLDIYPIGHARMNETDLDVFCLVDGRLFIGECKNSSSSFKIDKAGNCKTLNNLLKISDKIKPDTMVLACTMDEGDKLDKAKKYLEYHMRDWEYKPKILAYIPQEPDYFGLEGYKYFA